MQSSQVPSRHALARGSLLRKAWRIATFHALRGPQGVPPNVTHFVVFVSQRVVDEFRLRVAVVKFHQPERVRERPA